MAITADGFVPEQIKTNVIKIYSYKLKNLVGCVYNPFTKETKDFLTTFQMLEILENIMDETDFPQATTKWRSFNSDSESKKENVVVKAETSQPVIATFNLKVLFRQNSTWQGSLVWADQSSVSQFRSVYEMLILMDSVL